MRTRAIAVVLATGALLATATAPGVEAASRHTNRHPACNRKHAPKCRKHARRKRSPTKKTPAANAPGLGSPSSGAPTTPTQQAPPAGMGTITGQQAIDEFTRAMTGSKLTRHTQSSDGGNTYDDSYAFCSGTFTEHYESFISSPSGGVNQAYDYNGTWKVVDAAISSDRTRAQGRVQYTSTNPDTPSGEVIVTLIGANQAFVGNDEYQRSGGGGGC